MGPGMTAEISGHGNAAPARAGRERGAATEAPYEQVAQSALAGQTPPPVNDRGDRGGRASPPTGTSGAPTGASGSATPYPADAAATPPLPWWLQGPASAHLSAEQANPAWAEMAGAAVPASEAAAAIREPAPSQAGARPGAAVASAAAGTTAGVAEASAAGQKLQALLQPAGPEPRDGVPREPQATKARAGLAGEAEERSPVVSAQRRAGAHIANATHDGVRPAAVSAVRAAQAPAGAADTGEEADPLGDDARSAAARAARRRGERAVRPFEPPRIAATTSAPQAAEAGGVRRAAGPVRFADSASAVATGEGEAGQRVPDAWEGEFGRQAVSERSNGGSLAPYARAFMEGAPTRPAPRAPHEAGGQGATSWTPAAGESAATDRAAFTAPATAPTEADTRLDGLRATVRVQTVRALGAALSEARQEVVVTLRPPSLGRIRIQLQVDQERLHARLQAERPEVEQILWQDRDVLRQRLGEQGLRLETIAVERGAARVAPGAAASDGGSLTDGLDARDAGTSGQAAQDSGGQSEHDSRPHAAHRLRLGAERDVLRTEEPPATPSAPRGAVDVRA